ncbi:MAG: DNA internalization-related competence protein ComEC/Rec2 [Gammaproteobacteria bacterium RIFCSPLOWO2_02_FULL_42_14]|nr:MAG: DNA internalization-related competence protein ComEC/Rec2 [Gammaproteobacteria bacterium RIFCSPHIGHO2_02_FULL_42_43]OGT27349.1 MAG: DNA internalization-related competence protein ComEC/Rec2 [Gammaproteobacteria bacterium RIFCSPHIGHO2_01_FULL_42_8]OGT52666.1 MAG: DNA internalization-related competence protein ComEC/Rec2 [Gammaproteobacteria bacterium RIFCSPHIGHO2_12_FULL_41_25]OGT62875.1 MAG: DNA internalization-related competence protein ComEC/Rec2 [Gammaproteobacteria bacterium RIFCSPLO
MPIRIILFFFTIVFIALRGVWIDVHSWSLPQTLIEKRVNVACTINSIPEKKFHGIQFQCRALKFNQQSISTLFLLRWYRHFQRVSVGERWEFVAKLKPPIGSHNPGGFDYEQFLKSSGVSATGSVIAGTRLFSDKKNSVLSAFRAHVQQQIQEAVANTSFAGFLSAISVGLRDQFSQEDWQLFRNTGTNHLVAIAGLHIGFVFVTFYFLTQWLWRKSTFLLLKMPAPRAALLIAWIAACGYVSVSGFAIPALRSIIMLSCFVIAQWCYQPMPVMTRLIYAVLAILIWNPWSIVDNGFWLSFFSIIVLTLTISGRLQQPNKLIRVFRMQVAIAIGLTPLLFLFFQEVSLISLLANAIAIPYVGFLILPICVLAMILVFFHLTIASHFLFLIDGKLLWLLWKFLAWISSFSFAAYYHAIYNPFVLIAAVIGVLFLLAPRGWSGKWLGCFGLFPLFFYSPALPSAGAFWVSVIDVGQGLSVLVQTKHHVLVYDTGAHFPGGFDYGESVVAPFLRYRGVSRIDRMEISHGDNDHSGGAQALLRDFKVQSVFTSAPKLIQTLHAHYCVSGQQWIWDGVYFNTLNPVQNAVYEDNNSSCVLRISNHHASILLTGDIQAESEKLLADHDGDALKSTVLLVPHHGSKTSSTAVFLNAVRPDIAIVSAGRYNRYHLPASVIVDRYNRRKIKLYNTADDGEISIRFSPQGQVKLNPINGHRHER